MNKVERMRKRRDKMIQEYCTIVLSNLENGKYFDETESLLLKEWGLLNDQIINLKKANVQKSDTNTEGNGLSI